MWSVIVFEEPFSKYAVLLQAVLMELQFFDYYNSSFQVTQIVVFFSKLDFVILILSCIMAVNCSYINRICRCDSNTETEIFFPCNEALNSVVLAIMFSAIFPSKFDSSLYAHLHFSTKHLLVPHF